MFGIKTNLTINFIKSIEIIELYFRMESGQIKNLRESHFGPS